MEPISIKNFESKMMRIFGMLAGCGHMVDLRKRILESKVEYLSAKMEGIKGENTGAQIGNKRKRDYDLCGWRDEGQELVSKAKCLLSQTVDGGWSNFLMTVKMEWDVDNLIDALEAHDKKGDELFGDVNHVSKARVLYHGYQSYHIPVKPLLGQVASSTLNQLEVLLKDGKVGRIVIHGDEGIGKTFFMKHLHNRARGYVGKFDHVFWVTFPHQCSVKHLQDAVAAVVNCDLGSNDTLNSRARKLSGVLEGLDSFVLFLDGLPSADFSLDQVGIPIPAEGGKCKLVLTTRSTLGWRFLDGFKAFKLVVPPPEEAYELFMREARINTMYDSSLGDAPRLLADRCCRVPRTIVNVATRMCGIDDPREWKNALFESGFWE